MQANVHEDFSREKTHEGPTNRSFGLTVGGVLALIALVPMLRSKPPRLWALVPAAILLVAGAIVPSVLTLPNRLWMKLAELISKITNPIILSLMFYLLFTPAALICRLLGKDLLRLKADKELDTYWIVRQPAGPPPATMSNQF
jgi:hypothetical protein